MSVDINSYIVESAKILVPVLYILGVFIKKIPNIPNWTIPFILLGCAIGLSFGLLGVTVPALIQAILVTGGAVLGNEIIKQGIKGIKEIKINM